MTATIAETQAAPLTSDQYRVLLAYGRGGNLTSIVKELKLSDDFVNGTVSRLAAFNRQRAAELVRQYERNKTTAPARHRR